MVIFLAVAVELSEYHQKVLLKNAYQNEIRVELNKIQIQIKEAVENNDRNELRGVALEYERLGAVYANASSQLFGSYLDTGEWGNIANILIGNYLPCELFQSYDGPLTKEESKFLEQLLDVNDQLLLAICDDATFRNVNNISIQSLKKILNNYHLEALRDFLDGIRGVS
jgi:hypothetical protein